MPKKPARPLRTVALLSVKGGAAKTSTVIHTAVAATLAGERCLILDADASQGSCLLWVTQRTAEYPKVEAIEPQGVPKRIERARAEGYTYAFVDSQPRGANTLAPMLAAADYIVIPVQAAFLDIGALEKSIAIAEAAGVRGCILLTRCPSRAPEVDETREALRGLSLPVAPVAIYERRAYPRALAVGQGVNESQPGSPAAAEISALWRHLRKATA
jgi:chromosome partitioning protein